MYLYLAQIRYLIKGSYHRCLRTRVNLKGIQLPCTSGDRVCSHFPRWHHLPGPAPIWAGSLCCEGIINLLPGAIGGRVPFTASCLLKACVAPSIRLRFPFCLTKVEHTYSTGRHCRPYRLNVTRANVQIRAENISSTPKTPTAPSPSIPTVPLPSRGSHWSDFYCLRLVFRVFLNSVEMGFLGFQCQHFHCVLQAGEWAAHGHF